MNSTLYLVSLDSLRTGLQRRHLGWNSAFRLILFTFSSVSLHASTDKIFPADAVVNVTLSPYEARPDDGIDDTAAIQRAITENVDSGRTLYFPAGTYLISDTLSAKNSAGLWRAHLTLQGQNRNTTILKLMDRTAGFGDPKTPKPMLATGSHWQDGDSLDGGGNKAFRNNIFDFTFDTGSGNPCAVAVDYAVSNQGAIKDVSIRGNGCAGITLRRRIPGPGLIKNVEIDGFEVGIDVGDLQYGLTLENVVVKNQKAAGIRTDRNLLHIRRLKSENSVPAVMVTDRIGCLTLIGAELSGGGISCAGTFFGRDVIENGKNTSRSEPRLLDIEETPEFWNDNLDNWRAVGPREPGEKDDTVAIQRAMDSGKDTIYFPNDRVYFLSDTVVVRGTVRQVLGMGSEISLGAAKEPFSDKANPRPLFRIDPTTSPEVFFENMFFNAQYPGEVLFENNSPATLIIKHSAGWVGAEGHRRAYRNTAKATGKIFLEDVFLPGWEFRGQQVWARQFNPENYDGDGSTPQVANFGGKLWILGFKTEGPAPFLETSRGGTTELLGAYNYISAAQENPVPQGSVPYLAENSFVALTFATDNFRDIDYPVYIRQIHQGRTVDWKGPDLPSRNGHSGDRSFAIPRLPIAP